VGTTNEPNSSLEETLGQVIRGRREFLGLSVTKASSIAGITRQSWTALENGDVAVPQAKTRRGIETALNWPAGKLSQLLRGIDTPTEEAVPTSTDVLWQNRGGAVLATLAGDDLVMAVQYAEMLSQHRMAAFRDGIHAPRDAGQVAGDDDVDRGAGPRP
jgi:transcriptional regulator with XRE-family HTH domain